LFNRYCTFEFSHSLGRFLPFDDARRLIATGGLIIDFRRSPSTLPMRALFERRFNKSRTDRLPVYLRRSA
jgi:hypothetical protein